ncbi:MAG: TIGR01244 family sulfur transferase [Halioglobus sp.]|nr:TIGR01244 family phosphatase [Halieaceae bacterium]MDG2410667.1 TIGR01244 family sulfur transferase [Halioglobus sp.]
MKIVKLTDTLGVSAQITPQDVAEIAARGYRVLINNRPEGEEEAQPTESSIAAAARDAGIEYHFMPVTHSTFPGPHFDAMSDLLDDQERPVLAFCRSGTRCANLWVASVDAIHRKSAAGIAKQRGFDLGMVSRLLAQGGTEC